MSPGGREGDGPKRRRRRGRTLEAPVLRPASRDQLEELEARAGGREDDADAPPPVGGSWERLYTGVVLTLLLYIVALLLFTRAYAP